MECTRHEGWLEGLEAICADDEARRELLWLRAKQNDDESSIRALERIDPGLPDRLSWASARFESWRPMLRWSRDAEHAWGKIYDVCFDAHAARLTGRPVCGCGECRSLRAGVHWRREPPGSRDGR